MERLAVLMQDHQNSRGLVNLPLKISAGIVILPNTKLSRNQGVTYMSSFSGLTRFCPGLSWKFHRGWNYGWNNSWYVVKKRWLPAIDYRQATPFSMPKVKFAPEGSDFGKKFSVWLNIFVQSPILRQQGTININLYSKEIWIFKKKILL